MFLLDTRHPRTLLTLLCLLLWLPGLFTLPPGDRDESRFAQATKQMIETGDFVRIQNGEEARNRKPIGIHWLQTPFAAAARAARIATENPIWPYRMPSVLGAWIAVLTTFAIGKRWLGGRTGLLAGAMLAGSVILTVEAHIAKTDAALLAATTLAMSVLIRAYLDPGGLLRRDAALFWAALGAGVLLKGPVTPMVAALAAASLVLCGGRRFAWLAALRPAWGVALLLLIVLPWFVAIDVATEGRFFADAVGGDLGRKLGGADDAHGGFPGLHLLLSPLLLWPSTLLLPAGLVAAWRDRAAPLTRALLAWIVPVWLVFEAVPTKLPHYTLPLYPALCLLLARVALDPMLRPVPRWTGTLGLVLFLAATFVLAGAAAALPMVLGSGFWLAIPAVVAAGLMAWCVLREGTAPRAALAALVTAPVMYWALLQIELPHLQPLWIAPRVVAMLPPGGALGSVGFSEPSLMFLAGTSTQWLATPADGARALDDGRVRVVLVPDRDEAAFRAEADRLGLTPRELGEIAGFNYSRGRRVALTLFGG